MGLIEKYGTGIKRVRSMFVDYKLREPTFELIPGGFAATIYADTENPIQTNDPLNDSVNSIYQISDNVTDNVTDKRISQLVELITLNSKISTNRLAKILGVSRMTILRDIDSLKNKNLINRVGTSKGGYWQINNK